jgi:hypothetical protein
MTNFKIKKKRFCVVCVVMLSLYNMLYLDLSLYNMLYLDISLYTMLYLDLSLYNMLYLDLSLYNMPYLDLVSTVLLRPFALLAPKYFKLYSFPIV